MTSRHRIGLHILRIGLAFVFLWFGFSQLSDVTAWTTFVPTSLTHIIDAGTLVMLNAFFEICAGFLIAIAVLVRPLAILLGLHLIFIALSIGLTAVGVRDIGLAIATFALACMFTPEDRMFFPPNVSS